MRSMSCRKRKSRLDGRFHVLKMACLGACWKALLDYPGIGDGGRSAYISERPQ